MTVAELIVKLQEMPQDLPVFRDHERLPAEIDCVAISPVETVTFNQHGRPISMKEHDVVTLSSLAGLAYGRP